MTADPGEMRELILPTLRAGCEMHENYTPSTDEPGRQWAAQCPGLAQRGRTPCQWSCQGRVRVVSGAVPIVVA